MLSRAGVASRAGRRHSASINSVSAPCRFYKKCAANEGAASPSIASIARRRHVLPARRAPFPPFGAASASSSGLWLHLQRY